MTTDAGTPQEQTLPLAAPLQSPPRSHAELHDELHARPPLRTTPCCVVSYWAQAGLPAEVADAALRVACADAGQPAPASGRRHHLIETGSWALKYERHGEFVSWQLRMDLPADPSQEPELLLGAMLRADARYALSPGFFSALGDAPMLAATHVVVWPAEEDGMLRQARRVMAQLLAATRTATEATHDLIGSWIADDRAAMFTHLLLDEAGFTRFLLLDVQLSEQQRAREVQRIVEIEGYRALAMLGFPLAQQESVLLRTLERRLLQAVDQFAAQGQATAAEQQVRDQQVFAELVAIASEVEHGVARSRYRFSATRAYHRIVERRLQGLRESRIQGVQTLGGFLSLSGYARDSLAGNYLGMANLVYYRRLNEQSLLPTDLPVYVGGSLEAGNVWFFKDDAGFDDLRYAASLFLGVDSPLGPIYLGVGLGEHDQRALYLQVGQLFD